MNGKKLIFVLIPILATIGGVLLLLSTVEESLDNSEKHFGEHDLVAEKGHDKTFPGKTSQAADHKENANQGNLRGENPYGENNAELLGKIDKLLEKIDGSALTELELLIPDCDDKVIEKLLDILSNDSRTRVRAAVALVLGRFKTISAKIKDALLEALRKDKEMTVKVHVIRGLQLLPFDPEIDLRRRREIWRNMFPPTDSTWRWGTYDQKYSQFFPLPDVKHALIDIILDARYDSAMRITAMTIQPREGKLDEDILRAMVEVAKSKDEEWDIREVALGCIIEVNSKEMTDFLLDLASHDEEKSVRMKIICRLDRGYANDPAVASTVKEIYQTDEDSEIKEKCISTLAYLLRYGEYGEYLDFLESLLRDEHDGKIRALAIQQFNRPRVSNQRRFMQILEQAAETDESEKVRQTAKSAIEKVKSKSEK